MNPYVGILLDKLLPLVVSLLLVPLAFVFIRFIAKKLNIHINEAQEKQLQSVLSEALNYAEEWARKKIKTGDTKPTGAQKLEEALAFVITEVERRGWDTLAKEKLVSKLLAALGVSRNEPAPVPAPAPTPVDPPK